MKFVMLVPGESGTKQVLGVERVVQPCVGVTWSPAVVPTVGVGMFLPEAEAGSGLVYGLTMPHRVIQAWRAMKLLECVTIIVPYTLRACWTAVDRELAPGVRFARYDQLAAQCPNVAEFDTWLTEVRRQVPPAEVLMQLISTLGAHGLEADIHELAAELKAGTIVETPHITTLMRQGESYRAVRACLRESTVPTAIRAWSTRPYLRPKK